MGHGPTAHGIGLHGPLGLGPEALQAWGPWVTITLDWGPQAPRVTNSSLQWGLWPHSYLLTVKPIVASCCKILQQSCKYVQIVAQICKYKQILHNYASICSYL